MKRILIYSTVYYPFVGGAEVAMKEITDRLSSDDFCFVMITARMDRSLPKIECIGNIEVHRFGIGNAFFDKYLLALFGSFAGLRLHKQEAFAGVWALMASYNGFAAQRFAAKTKVPFVLTLQEGDPIDYILKKVRLVRPWFNKIFSQATVLQAISTYLLQWGKDMGFAGKEAVVIPNGVDIDRFTVSDEDRVQARKDLEKQYGISQEATVLVTSSRLVTKNAVEDVIRALTHLDSTTHFVVFGDGELREHLVSVRDSLGLQRRVHFHGYVDHSQLAAYIAAGDIFIRPSLSEGLGCSFLETMAAGTPVIATEVGGIPDFLTHKETGLFCKVRDPESIAEQVRLLQEDDQLYAHIVAQARVLVEEVYDWDSIATRMKNLFQKHV